MWNHFGVEFGIVLGNEFHLVINPKIHACCHLSLSEVAVFIWLGSTGFLGDCNRKTLLEGGSSCRRTLGGVHAQKTLFIKVGTASWALVVLVITKDATMN